MSAKTFDLHEASLLKIQTALARREISSKELVQAYLSRISEHDKKLNAVRVINPQALETAQRLDAERFENGPKSMLHGIPIVVKDNFDTADLTTTAGSRSLLDSLPPDDAFVVKRLRDAGAIVLCKSNMAEFAFSPYETVGSAFGVTHNPYALGRVPAGSSGGTAAAVAANLGAAGLGTDTGNSIRGPSAHCALVGIRPTIGLTSRDGIIPLNYTRDIGGPMCRTVADAAILLGAIAGYDKNDPTTAESIGRTPACYTGSLVAHGLKRFRLGVMRDFFSEEGDDAADPEVRGLMEQALLDLQALGAELVDPFVLPDWEKLRADSSGGNPFKWEINAYLKGLGPNAPVNSLEQILESGGFHESIKDRLVGAQDYELPPWEDPAYLKAELARQKYRVALLSAMADHAIDALVYPTWSHPPRKIGDLESPHGNNNHLICPPTGFPAITVPMGFTYNKYPAGLQLQGRPYSEPLLIRIAYAYEQNTLHRVAPKGF